MACIQYSCSKIKPVCDDQGEHIMNYEVIRPHMDITFVDVELLFQFEVGKLA